MLCEALPQCIASFNHDRTLPDAHCLAFGSNTETSRPMKSMTGYGRGEADHAGTKFGVELNSVNRKQSDIVINLPRDLVELEPRIRQAINENISRGRTNVVVTFHD